MEGPGGWGGEGAAVGRVDGGNGVGGRRAGGSGDMGSSP